MSKTQTDDNRVIQDTEQEARQVPETAQTDKATPETKQTKKPKQSTKQRTKDTPDATTQQRDLPYIGNPENSVLLGDEMVEIKPMKLRYQRNATALFYKALETYPLPDILGDVYVFDENRDGDKCVMDFLIAVFNDPDLVVRHYDELDTETVYKIVAIFRRVNKIDEREQEVKKRVAAMAMESRSKTASR